MAKGKKKRELSGGETFRQEARRLSQLPARQRKVALAVHWNIAEDARLAQATRDHARFVAETLEGMVEKILAKKRR